MLRRTARLRGPLLLVRLRLGGATGRRHRDHRRVQAHDGVAGLRTRTEPYQNGRLIKTETFDKGRLTGTIDTL